MLSAAFNKKRKRSLGGTYKTSITVKKGRQATAFQELTDLRKSNTGRTLNHDIGLIVSGHNDPYVTRSSLNYLFKKSITNAVSALPVVAEALHINATCEAKKKKAALVETNKKAREEKKNNSYIKALTLFRKNPQKLCATEYSILIQKLAAAGDSSVKKSKAIWWTNLSGANVPINCPEFCLVTSSSKRKSVQS